MDVAPPASSQSPTKTGAARPPDASLFFLVLMCARGLFSAACCRDFITRFALPFFRLAPRPFVRQRGSLPFCAYHHPPLPPTPKWGTTQERPPLLKTTQAELRLVGPQPRPASLAAGWRACGVRRHGGGCVCVCGRRPCALCVCGFCCVASCVFWWHAFFALGRARACASAAPLSQRRLLRPRRPRRHNNTRARCAREATLRRERQPARTPSQPPFPAENDEEPRVLFVFEPSPLFSPAIAFVCSRFALECAPPNLARTSPRVRARALSLYSAPCTRLCGVVRASTLFIVCVCGPIMCSMLRARRLSIWMIDPLTPIGATPHLFFLSFAP